MINLYNGLGAVLYELQINQVRQNDLMFFIHLFTLKTILTTVITNAATQYNEHRCSGHIVTACFRRISRVHHRPIA